MLGNAGRKVFTRPRRRNYFEVAMVLGIGIVSGNYIFGRPLREYAEEQRRLEAENVAKNKNEEV